MIANVAVMTVIIALGVLWYFVDDSSGFSYFFAVYSMQVLLWLFLGAWVVTLVKLYRDLKHSKKLLPNKRIFIVHGSLLTTFLVLFLLAMILTQLYLKTTVGSPKYLTLRGIVDLDFLVYNSIEVATFFLVVSLMLPVSKQAMLDHQALQKCLLNGFVKPEELENAILAQHPDMPEDIKR